MRLTVVRSPVARAGPDDLTFRFPGVLSDSWPVHHRPVAGSSSSSQAGQPGPSRAAACVLAAVRPDSFPVAWLTMTLAEGGGIFVSYRRQESSHLAGRLYDRLADRFGEGQVFIDVDTIEPGVDFAEEIFRAVAACEVLLAIIGPTWLTVSR